MIELEEPAVRRILDALPCGVALDAACGTGRHAEFLLQQGHQVVGVDTSQDMLAVARKKLPILDARDSALSKRSHFRTKAWTSWCVRWR